MRYFTDPLILSSRLVSGRVKGEIGQSYGMIVDAGDIPKEYLSGFLELVDQQAFAVTQMCQTESKGRARYLMCVVPKPDAIMAANQYLQLSQFITKGRLEQNQRLFARIFGQLLIQVNRVHQKAIVHGALCPTNIYFNCKTTQLLLGPPLGFSKPFVEQFAQKELEAMTPQEVRQGKIQKLTWQTDVYQVGYVALCLTVNKILGEGEITKFLDDDDYAAYQQRQYPLLTPAVLQTIRNLMSRRFEKRPRPGVVLEILQKNVDIQLESPEEALLQPLNFEDIDLTAREQRAKQTEREIQEVNEKIAALQKQQKSLQAKKGIDVTILPPREQAVERPKTTHVKRLQDEQPSAYSVEAVQASQSTTADKKTLIRQLEKTHEEYARVLQEYELFKQNLQHEERRKTAAAKLLSEGRVGKAKSASKNSDTRRAKAASSEDSRMFANIPTDVPELLRSKSESMLSAKDLSAQLAEKPKQAVPERTIEVQFYRLQLPLSFRAPITIKIQFITPEGTFEGTLRDATLLPSRTAGVSVEFNRTVKLSLRDKKKKSEGDWTSGVFTIEAGDQFQEFRVTARFAIPTGPQWGISTDGSGCIQYGCVW